MNAEEALTKAETLLARLEEARGRLEQTDDPQQALGVLEELVELAREVQSEIERAKREVDANA